MNEQELQDLCDDLFDDPTAPQWFPGAPVVDGMRQINQSVVRWLRERGEHGVVPHVHLADKPHKDGDADVRLTLSHGGTLRVEYPNGFKIGPVATAAALTAVKKSREKK